MRACSDVSLWLVYVCVCVRVCVCAVVRLGRMDIAPVSSQHREGSGLWLEWWGSAVAETRTAHSPTSAHTRTLFVREREREREGEREREVVVGCFRYASNSEDHATEVWLFD